MNNLELLLTTEIKDVDLSYYYRTSGKYYAKKVMDHFGYSKDAVRCYLSSALTYENRDTIHYLFTRAENREWLSKGIKKKIFTGFSPEMSSLVSWLFKERYVVFKEEDWNRLKQEQAALYEALSVDV